MRIGAVCVIRKLLRCGLVACRLAVVRGGVAVLCGGLAVVGGSLAVEHRGHPVA